MKTELIDNEDEIDSLNKKNKETKLKISNLKDWTVKNMVYSNIDIPSVWKQKQGYREFMFQAMNNDKLFFDYLSSAITLNDPYKNKEIANMNINSKKKNEKERLPEIVNDQFNFRKNSNLTSNDFSRTNNFLGGGTTLQNSNMYTSSQSFFRSKATFKTSDGKNLERLALMKRLESQKLSKTENNFSKRSKSTLLMTKPKIQQTKTKTKELGQFLNINSNVKKLELKNKDVKELFEEINNFGPYFSHCPSCNNKNISFYQNMKSENAIKLLSYLRDYKFNLQSQYNIK